MLHINDNQVNQSDNQSINQSASQVGSVSQSISSQPVSVSTCRTVSSVVMTTSDAPTLEAGMDYLVWGRQNRKEAALKVFLFAHGDSHISNFQIDNSIRVR